MRNKQKLPSVSYKIDLVTDHSPTLTNYKKTIFIAGIALLLASFVGFGGYLFFTKYKALPSTSNLNVEVRKRITYAFDGVSEQEQADTTQLLRTYATKHNYDLLVASGTPADITIASTTEPDDIRLTTKSEIKLTDITSGTPLSNNAKTLSLRLKKSLDESEKKALTEAFAPAYASSPRSWTYLAVGDIIPARDVYTYSKRNGFLFPYAKISDTLKSADLTVTNVETTIADGQANGEGAGMMVFTAPSKAFDGLVASGIDGINLANNHSMNGGSQKVTEMLTGLDVRKIGHFGVSTTNGINTWATTVNGIKVIHLSFNTVPGSIDPTASTPGARRIPLKPWGSLSESDVAFVQGQIKAAKQSADVVIPWFQWGTEYTHDANDEQRRLAHAAIDAGAETVIGTHPHWTQGIEWYNGHFIAYSLGNFIFDQNWSDETRRSFAAQITFTGTKVTGVQLMPAYIENWVQPRFLAPSEALYKQILSDVAAHSWWQ
mgnify:CR=1 FL=1